MLRDVDLRDPLDCAVRGVGAARWSPKRWANNDLLSFQNKPHYCCGQSKVHLVHRVRVEVRIATVFIHFSLPF